MNLIPPTARVPFVIASILAIIVITAAITVYVQFNIQKTSLLNSSPNEFGQLPVNPSSKDVTWAYTTYNFFGEVKNVSRVFADTKVTLANQPNVPSFFVTNQTKVYRLAKQLGTSGDTTFPAGAPELKNGQKVAVIASYDQKTKSWQTLQMYITPQAYNKTAAQLFLSQNIKNNFKF